MRPNEIRSGTPSVVRMLIGRSQTLLSLLLPHSRSVSNSLRRRKPGFALRMHGCGRRLPRCRRNPRLSAGTILARVAAAKSSRSAASIEGLPGSPYRACCEEGARQTGAITSFSNPFSLATLTVQLWGQNGPDGPRVGRAIRMPARSLVNGADVQASAAANARQRLAGGWISQNVGASVVEQHEVELPWALPSARSGPDGVVG